MQQINWKVGITSDGEVYISFSDGKEHARFAMDKETAGRIGDAMKDAVTKADSKLDLVERMKRAGGRLLSRKAN